MTVFQTVLEDVSGGGRPGGVPRNDKDASAPRPFAEAVKQPSRDALIAARFLSLAHVAEGHAALALLDDVMACIAVALSAGRRRQRGVGRETALRQAVGVILGGVLLRWASDDPTVAFRSRDKATFTGGPVSFRQFDAATTAMVSAGLLGNAPGISFLADGFEDGGPKWSERMAGRYWPTADLLALAMARGVTQENVVAEFPFRPPTRVPVVAAPVVLRALAPRRRGASDARPPVVPISPRDATAAAIRRDVQAHNAMAGEWSIAGCCPPRWRRDFRGALTLLGRWHAVGEGNYQQRREAERIADIRMNGEPVAEIDVKACHLSILSALAGAPLAPEDGDPYAVAGVPRAVVKQWIVCTLGNGTPPRATPRQHAATFAGYTMREVGAAILARHPALADPASVVPVDFAAPFGGARRVLPHYLMGLEAEALTVAMRALRERGVLTLPMHDGLIVPRSAVAAAREAMGEAFREVAGFTPILDVAASA